MGAFEFADESAGYKTVLRLMASADELNPRPETPIPIWLRPKACIRVNGIQLRE